MAGRARRTRVYDCNYNMGEQYYKSALDNLDKKKNPPPRESVEKLLSSRPKLNVDELLDEDLLTARRRAERAINEDAFFDSRGARIPKPAINSLSLEDDIDAEVQSSLNRIRANKKLSTAFSKDMDFEDTLNTVKRRARIDLGEKLMDTAGEGDAGETIRRRALKMVTRASDDYVDPKTLTKWTAIDDGQRSAASLRAKATKARLNDLETEMFERSEKQQAREQRSAQLKKFLVESDIETTTTSSRAERRVNF